MHHKLSTKLDIDDRLGFELLDQSSELGKFLLFYYNESLVLLYNFDFQRELIQPKGQKNIAINHFMR